MFWSIRRARHCPQSPFHIATKGPRHEVLVFDYSKHPTVPAAGDSTCKPEMRLSGHTAEGYGLSWSTLQKGYLLSGSDDRKACVWDTNATAGRDGTVAALHTFSEHGDVVEDVQWSRHAKDIFGSVSDDKHLYLWDIRTAGKPAQVVEAHKAELNSLSFNPTQQHLLLTASSDRTVAMWDNRKLAKPMHSFVGHTDEVFSVQWCPFNEGVFASSGSDRRLHIWDVSRIGAEQTPEDAEDGPPELLVSAVQTTHRVLFLYFPLFFRSLFMVGTRRRCLTSPGPNPKTGWWRPLLKTTFCRFGSWQRTSGMMQTTKMPRALPMTTWSRVAQMHMPRHSQQLA